MRKVIIYTLLVLLVFILVVFVMILSNPLKKSNKKIRESILEVMPIGTSMEDVIKKIEDKKWEINHISYERGYGIDKDGIPGENRSVCIGEKSMRVYIGSYRNIFEISVLAYFGFDENSKLIEVSVRKDTDGF